MFTEKQTRDDNVSFLNDYADRVAENFRMLQQITPEIMLACDVVWSALKRNQTIFFAGNGGSAADSQHLAADILGRYKSSRKAMPAIALTVDTSVLTALANDYGYETALAHQLDGLGREGDVLVAISTSGNSENILRTVKMAREKGIHTIGMTGENGGAMRNMVDLCLCAPSDSTNHIQEMHIAMGHMICEYVEANAKALDEYQQPHPHVLNVARSGT
jgi:D-sedoheptulose 7-phosphate isomerase